MTFKELKNTCKELAANIRNLKSQRKHVMYGYVDGLLEKQYEFRHHHIAYSQLRGRTRDEIENPARDNKPSESYINAIIARVEVRDAKPEVEHAG